MPVAFFKDRRMTTDQFRKVFERYMRMEDGIWNYRLTNLPRHDVAHVYLVFDGGVQYKVNCVCYERNISKAFDDAPDGKVRDFPRANWVLLTGPAVRAPYDIPMKGFQGFRYVTNQLF